MSFKVFTKPREAFEEAIDKPNMAIALLIVIVTGVLIGIASYAYTASPVAIITAVLVMAVQWLIMSFLLWAFEFMFRSKKKGFKEKSFAEAASAAGTLWMVVLAAAVVFNVAMLSFMAGLVILSAVFVIIIIGLFVLFMLASYSMVKVVLEAERGRAIVAWLLLMVLAALIWAVAQLAWARIFG